MLEEWHFSLLGPRVAGGHFAFATKVSKQQIQEVFACVLKSLEKHQP